MPEETTYASEFAQGYSHTGVTELWDEIYKIVISGENSAKNQAINEVENLITAMDNVFIGPSEGELNPKGWFQAALRKDAELFGSMLDQFMSKCKTEIFNASAAFTAEDKSMADWIDEHNPMLSGGEQ